MSPLHPYAAQVLADLKTRLPWETEFHQAVAEVFSSISPLLERNRRYLDERILERIIEPERVISFRVLAHDDKGNVEVHRGYRVQFNSALGPYKGGTRFHASVGVGSLKFLGFEQTLKNALTGLPLGGGKGGADFATRGRSETEMMRFCHSYMAELFRHIGQDTDVPAGDIGVSGREIGYLYGQYKRLSGRFDGALTGKNVGWGGSRLRPESTGYGVAYLTELVLEAKGTTVEGKRVALSGFGQVAWGTAKKITELGGKVVTISGPDGFVYEPDGLSDEKIAFMQRMRITSHDAVEPYAEKFGAKFYADKRPWGVPCDIAIPCAIQNELEEADARELVANGCQLVVEGANMPLTAEAQQVVRAANVTFVPGKAANAGGVACSGLEMTQNRTGQVWHAEVVDEALRTVMGDIHNICTKAAAEYGKPGDYMLGANIGGFIRVADAMIEQGAI